MRALLTALMLTLIAGLAVADDAAYRLNPGDLIFVSVWKEQDMQGEVLVLPDGTISFPLVGQLVAGGHTTEEVEGGITERLQKYIPDAVVTVSVLNLTGNKIYVIGAVNRPGEFQVGRPIDVMQALSLAGGLTPFAGEGSIRVLRRENGQDIVLPFDYSEVKKGRQLEMNIELKSGDVVVVSGQSLF
jgi:polysaccharide export outer membrane protein